MVNVDVDVDYFDVPFLIFHTFLNSLSGRIC